MKLGKPCYRIIRVFVALILVLSMGIFSPAGRLHDSFAMGEEADSTTYIMDIKYFLADDDASAKSTIEEAGYVPVLENLNAGTNKNGVYIGYKTTKDRRKAITKLGLLAMDKGYEIMDYKKLEEKYKQSNYAAADALCTAAIEYVNNYNNGSPKAVAACEGMNLAYIPEEGETGLGDYILSMGENQDREFFRRLISTASSGVVSALISFLEAGMTPYKNDEDEDGNTITKNWAERVVENPLWEQVEDDTMTEEERSELDQNYQDSAKDLFASIQDFATTYETSEADYDPGRMNELVNDDGDMSEAVEDMEHLEQEDGDIVIVSSYNSLNEYMLNGDMPLGEWVVNFGKQTSEEVDLTQLYPIVDSFSDAERQMIGVSGFSSIIGCLDKSMESASAVQETIDEARDNIEKLRGDDSFSIWEGTQEDMFSKVYAYTNEAMRLNAAGKYVEEVESEKNEYYETAEEIFKWYGIVSGCVFLVSFMIGTYGLPLLFLSAGVLCAKLGMATVGCALAGLASSIMAVAGALASIFSWIFIVDLAIMALMVGYYIGKAIAALINYIRDKYTDKEYTTIPDRLIDVVELPDKMANVKYKIIESTNGSFKGDLNGYSAHRGWTCLYATTDTRIGSPLVVPESGDPFKVTYGDPADQSGRESLCFFGEVSAGNVNTGMEEDSYNGIYVSYTTEDSLGLAPDERYYTPSDEDEDTSYEVTSGGSVDAVSGNAVSGSGAEATPKPTATPIPSTTPDPNMKGKYYSDIVLSSAHSEDKAKSKLTKRGFYVLDRNLAPDARIRAENATSGDENTYTYLGYKVTSSVDNAIRDIRVAPFNNSTSLAFGSVNYGCAGTLGYPADNKDEESDYPADLDGLYFSKNEKSGSPIPAGNIHIVGSAAQAKEEWVPVTTFGGIPYNFNTTRISTTSTQDKWGDGRELPAYSYTAYITEEDHTWNETDIYLYYEPTETFTSANGTKYLSGIYFTFGADSDGRTEADFSELISKMNTLPNSKLMSDVNLAQSYLFRGYIDDSNQKYLHIGYIWSYNPYRAIYDVQAYQGTLYKPELPYTISKTTKYSKKNLGDPAEQQSYVAASVVVQRPLEYKDFGDDSWFVARGLAPENAIMSSNGLIGKTNYFLTDTYTTELQGDYDYGYSKMPLLPTGVFMSGYMPGKEPMTLDDIVITQNKHDAKILNSEISLDLSGETTLDGNAASGEFSSIQDIKRPYNTEAFNLSYPDWADDDEIVSAGPSCYIYKKNNTIKKKYISRVFVGGFTRDDSGISDSAQLKEVDKMVDHQALLIATSQASDEVIPVNVSVDQDDAWYRAKDDGMPLEKPAKEGLPAAYISVSRTDKVEEAITGMVLYKSKNKAVPQEIKVDSITYYCASNDKPITETNGTKYFLYYTYNDGATPGKPITEITASEDIFVSGQSTVLTTDSVDGKGDGKEAKPYGNTSQNVFIHAQYEKDKNTYYNKLYVGSSPFKKKALATLLEQECTEFIDMNLNKNAGGNYVYLGYKGYSLDEEKIRMKTTESARETERENQLQEAIYDVVCTVDKPYQPEGFTTELNQIYYKPVGDVDLNAGTNGPKIYMYYTTIYNAKKYNKNQGKDGRKIHSSMPNDYFKEPVTRIAFTECDRVPYLNGDSSSGVDNMLPWERVLYDDLKTPAELNDGAVWFDDDYESTDNRIYMFLQRERGHVKSYGEITGGHTTDTTAYGEMWWNK